MRFFFVLFFCPRSFLINCVAGLLLVWTLNAFLGLTLMSDQHFCGIYCWWRLIRGEERLVSRNRAKKTEQEASAGYCAPPFVVWLKIPEHQTWPRVWSGLIGDSARALTELVPDETEVVQTEQENMKLQAQACSQRPSDREGGRQAGGWLWPSGCAVSLGGCVVCDLSNCFDKTVAATL